MPQVMVSGLRQLAPYVLTEQQVHRRVLCTGGEIGSTAGSEGHRTLRTHTLIAGVESARGVTNVDHEMRTIGGDAGGLGSRPLPGVP